MLRFKLTEGWKAAVNVDGLSCTCGPFVLKNDVFNKRTVIVPGCARTVSGTSGARSLLFVFFLTALTCQQASGGTGKPPSQDLLFEGQGLTEVKQLVEQKRAVERELGELKTQLEKAGFLSLSQMR